jgi:glutamyl/glutaminyl-tRNA synthetase
MMLSSRIAPTPSGYLHMGNAMNFVLTWLWIRKKGGKLRLRIDDSDTTRSKPEFIEEIFRSLNWLGIDWDEGPQTPNEQEHIYSQALRAERYNELINQLVTSGNVFACTCSRKELQIRACNCRLKNIDLNYPDAALRIATPTEAVIVRDVKRGPIPVILDNEMKDFIIRRRDGIVAYQVASLTDDTDHDINLVLRGEDLLSSTAAQLYLASLIGAKVFAETGFYHHPLFYDEQGHKLSKSAGSLSLKTMREQGVSIEQFYMRLSNSMELKETFTSLKEMLNMPNPLLG